MHLPMKGSKMAKELELIPPLQQGEILLIQRTVGDKNVLMVVTLTGDAFDYLHKDRGISLTADLDTWGTTPHSDPMIANQRNSIDRLLAHLQAHCLDNDCPHR